MNGLHGFTMIEKSTFYIFIYLFIVMQLHSVPSQVIIDILYSLIKYTLKKVRYVWFAGRRGTVYILENTVRRTIKYFMVFLSYITGDKGC